MLVCRSTAARIAEVHAADTDGDRDPVPDGGSGAERRVHHVQRDREDRAAARGPHGVHAARAASRALLLFASCVPRRAEFCLLRHDARSQ